MRLCRVRVLFLFSYFGVFLNCIALLTNPAVFDNAASPEGYFALTFATRLLDSFAVFLIMFTFLKMMLNRINMQQQGGTPMVQPLLSNESEDQ